jgi:hypothetical protein
LWSERICYKKIQYVVNTPPISAKIIFKIAHDIVDNVRLTISVGPPVLDGESI